MTKSLHLVKLYYMLQQCNGPDNGESGTLAFFQRRACPCILAQFPKAQQLNGMTHKSATHRVSSCRFERVRDPTLAAGVIFLTSLVERLESFRFT